MMMSDELIVGAAVAEVGVEGMILVELVVPDTAVGEEVLAFLHLGSAARNVLVDGEIGGL